MKLDWIHVNWQLMREDAFIEWVGARYQLSETSLSFMDYLAMWCFKKGKEYL